MEKDNFEIVISDILLAISNIHYEDKEKELIKLKIQYVLCKIAKNQKVFEENTRLLDLKKGGNNYGK